MPAVNTTLWRSHPQHMTGKLYIHVPDVVFRRRVDSASFEYPMETIPYDNPDAEGGSSTDVLAGQTLRVLDGTTEELKGIARCRFANADFLIIAPVGAGVIAFADNDILEVLDERRIWVEVPQLFADGETSKDWGFGFNAALAQPPVANAGPDVTCDVDSSDEITVPFNGGNSYPVAEGATITGYQWDFKDGTVILGDSATATATVTFPAGKRYVSLTVTDSNGNTHTAYPLIAAIDGTAAKSYRVRNARLRGNVNSGWEAAFELLDLDLSAIPYGAKVIFYTDEKYGNTSGGIAGQSGRENIKFVGWLTEDTVRISAYEFTGMTIAAQNTQALMAFSQVVERISSPASWFEMANLTWWRFVHYLLHWHTTLIDLHDLERPSYHASYPSQQLEAQAGSIDDQMNFLAQAVKARWTCDYQGRFYLRRNPHFMTNAEQAALTTIVDMTTSDYKAQGVVFEHLHRDQVGIVWGDGVKASATDLLDVRASAPGKLPSGQGIQQAQLDRQLLDESDPYGDLQERVGRYYALRNLRLRRARVPMLHHGMVADPAWQEWVKWTLPSSTNTRGIAFSSKPFVLSAVEVNFNDRWGFADEVWTLENTPGTKFAKGVIHLFPGQEAPDGLDEYEYELPGITVSEQLPFPYDFVVPIPVIPDILNDGELIDNVTSTYAVAWARTGVGLTDDYTVDEPEWVSVFTPAVDEEVIDVISAGSNAVYVLCTDGLYYSSDITLTTPTLQSSFTGGKLLRKTNTAGEILVLVSEDDPTTPWTENIDFTTGRHGWRPYSGTPLGLWTAGVGWEDEFKVLSGNGIRGTTPAFTAFANFSITAFSFNYANGVLGSSTTGSLTRINIRNSSDGSIATTDATPMKTGTGSHALSTSFPRSVRTLLCFPRIFSVASDTTDYGGSIEITGASVSGTGYNPFSKVRVLYSDDYGATWADTPVDVRVPDENAMDCDDYGLGIVIVAAANEIFFSTAYDGSYSLVSGLSGLPDALTDGNKITSIRIPALRQSGAANSVSTALEFWYTTDEGATYLATLNTSTGVATDVSKAITISATDYYVIGYINDGSSPETVYQGGNSLETFGGNTLIAAAVVKPVGGGDSHLVITDDGGSTWTDLGAFDGTQPRFVEPALDGNGNQLWVAGHDGILTYIYDGISIATKQGDFTTSLSEDDTLGAFTL